MPIFRNAISVDAEREAIQRLFSRTTQNGAYEIKILTKKEKTKYTLIIMVISQKKPSPKILKRKI